MTSPSRKTRPLPHPHFTGSTPEQLRILWNLRKRSAPRIVWDWLNDLASRRWVRAVCQGLILVLVALTGVLLFALPDPSDFVSRGTYLFAVGGFALAGLYIVVSVIMIFCVPVFRRQPHGRRNYTLCLTRARTVAVGGGIAVLAAAMPFVDDDYGRVFTMWLMLSALLYLWGHLLPDGAFSPNDFQPITRTEVLDMVEHLGKPVSGQNATISAPEKSRGSEK